MSTAPTCNEINTTTTTTTSTPPSTTTTNQQQEKALCSPERTFVFVGSGGSNKYNSGDDDVLAYVMSEEFEESAEEGGAACKKSIVGDCLCEPVEYEMHNSCSFDEMEQQPGLLQQQDFQAPPLPPPPPPSLSPPPKPKKAALRRTTSAPGPGRLARCPICRKRRGGPCGSDVASKHCYRRTGEWMARDQAMSMDGKKVRRTTIGIQAVHYVNYKQVLTSSHPSLHDDPHQYTII